jgi:hypothetical protein
METVTINFLGTPTKIFLTEDRYVDNGRLAIQAICEDGEPFGMLTVNLDTPLADDEICVKVWSENSAWVPQVLAALKSKFIPTGREVPTGFVTAPVYRIVS